MNTAARRNLIETLNIGPEPAIAREGSRAAVDPATVIPNSDALIVGGNMLAFSGEVKPPARSVVSLCLLFAQEVAKADADVSNPDLWVDRHDTVFKDLGWASAGGATQFTKLGKSGLDVHQAVLPLLTAAFAPVPAAGALIILGLKQLQEIDKGKPWITLFDKESRRFEHSEYRFVTVDDQGGTILLHLVVIRFTAVTERIQILFFKKKDTEIEFTIATRTLSADAAILAEIEPLLRARLLSRAADLIKSFDLPESE